MKVSYRKSYYKVGLKDFIIIEKEKIILLLKRFYRGFKRAKEHLKPLIIVIILSVIYIIITYFVGNIKVFFTNIKHFFFINYCFCS